MTKNILIFIPSILIIIFIAISCDNPKVIPANNNDNNTSQNLVNDPNDNNNPSANQNQQHKVIVKEVLNTPKYSYLRVDENNEEYWIAILKTEVKIGSEYAFEGGLLKRNFYSQEYDRIFEKVYLVSGISDISGNKVQTSSIEKPSEMNMDVSNIELAEGSIKIDDIIKQKDKYADKTVKVTGKCIKVNPNIMNRNWVHLSDGSGENIVITTNEEVVLGTVVNLEGTISINRDFGAGYKYDIIMEGAVLK